MKYALVIVLAALAGACSLDERAVRATVRPVETPSGTCSAVVVADGYALTAAHCAGARRVGGVAVTGARVVPGKDVAVLRVPGLGCPCAEIGALTDQYDVVLVGFPFAGQFEVPAQVATRGAVQGRGVNEGERVIIVTAQAAPGMSGGGMFVLEAGRPVVVGVVSRGFLGFPFVTIVSEILGTEFAAAAAELAAQEA